MARLPPAPSLSLLLLPLAASRRFLLRSSSMIVSLWAALRAYLARTPPSAARYDKLLVVVEGKHDVEFLRRISRILHRDEARLPDLSGLEGSGRLVFVPFGGGDIFGWTH